MNHLLNYAKRGGAVLALLMSPAIVAFGVPFAFGIASDIVAAAGARPVVLALDAVAALLLWQRLSRRRLTYAAKSIT